MGQFVWRTDFYFSACLARRAFHQGWGGWRIGEVLQRWKLALNDGAVATMGGRVNFLARGNVIGEIAGRPNSVKSSKQLGWDVGAIGISLRGWGSPRSRDQPQDEINSHAGQATT